MAPCESWNTWITRCCRPIPNISSVSAISPISSVFSPRAAIVTFHGPTVAHLGEVTSPAREQFYRMLTSPAPDLVCFRELQALSPGSARGPLIGGNLTTICSLVGTPYALPLAGKVLFVEDHNEAPYRLDRMLQQLRLSGSLTGIKAIILGSFTCCGDIRQVWEIFAALGESLKIPVLAGLPAGHQPDNFPCPSGRRLRWRRKTNRYVCIDTFFQLIEL